MTKFYSEKLAGIKNSSYLCINKSEIITDNTQYNISVMKNLLTIAILMFCFATVSFAQAEKTLIKSIAAESAVVALELPGEVAVSKWDKDFIRITATIKSDNVNEEILKKLVAFGRYDIITSSENGQMIINMPKVASQVIIKGVNMNELIKFEVQMPEGVEAAVKSETTAAAIQSM